MERIRDNMMSHFYFIVIFSIISFTNILPQDNTNNRMVDKSDGSINDLEKKIEQNANYYSNNLKIRLNLTDSQTRYVYDIMMDYYLGEPGNQTSQRAALRESKESYKLETEPLEQNVTNTEASSNNNDKSGNASSEANNKIENILDNEQMNRWKEIKDSWWVNVKTELYEGDQSINRHKSINDQKGEYEDNRDYENYDVYYPGYDYK